MTANFDLCFSLLMGEEGGYSNNPRDPGGETMWGITKRVALRWGYTGPMKLLPQATAKHIAMQEYWTPNGCDLLSTPVAYQVFDTAYNGGHAVQWLQEIVGVPADGVLGAVTAEAVAGLSTWEVLAKFGAKRLRYFASLKQPTFANGRMNRIADNLERGNLR